jgi:hypothetical protein
VKKRTLVCNALDKELGAVGLVEELGPLDHDGIKISVDGSREERGNAGCQTEASHCLGLLSIAQKRIACFAGRSPMVVRCVCATGVVLTYVFRGSRSSVRQSGNNV